MGSSKRLVDAQLNFRRDDNFFRVRKHLMAQPSMVRSSSTDRFFNSKKAQDPFSKAHFVNICDDDASGCDIWSNLDCAFYEDENEAEDTRLILDILKLEKKDNETRQIRKNPRQALSSIRKTCMTNNTRLDQ